jgi:hypothetical protein
MVSMRPHPVLQRRRLHRLVVLIWATLPLAAPRGHAAPTEPARPLAVRVQWGGGQPRAWSGRIAIVASGDARVPDALRWRTLSLEVDAASMTHGEGATILVHQPRPVDLDGVEIEVDDPRGLRLVAELGPARGGEPSATLDVPLCDLLVGPTQESLDGEGNRLTGRLAPGEPLRVTIDREDASSDARQGVPRPGDRLRFTVDPLLPVTADGTSVVDVRMRLTTAARPGEIASRTTTLVPLAGSPVDGAAAGRWTRFEPVVFDVTLPGEEGVYDVVLEAVERGSLRWSRAVVGRTFQVPAVAVEAAARPLDNEWRVVHELDPGSPKLHERLRRLPGVGLGDVPLPAIGLPAMPLPSFTRPSMVLPRLPAVPALSAVPSLPAALPSISSMVPRLGGLLATGHSRVEPHPLGPVLRLPAAESHAVPTWEGIVIAGVEPGRPHVVEIDYPTEQDATIAVSVLETDAGGGSVLQRHAGGFEVGRSAQPGPPAVMATHRCVFWPTTRHPVVVIANPSRDTTALFGRVRVLAGPVTLPGGGIPATAGRGLHAFLPHPDFAGFGGADRQHRGGGPALPDWGTHLSAIRHSSDMLRAHGAAGALVTVYARGAALWPSRHTREAALWDPGRVTDTGVDAACKDVLELLCRVYGREGQRVVPAVSFDAPLPDLETTIARGGAEPTGLLCVGRDGRPLRSDGGRPHYNVLDPRVQQVVESIVRELAGRLAEAPTVDGIALLMPHDGWLHMPGIAWGLDDVTFARFLAAVLPGLAADRMPPEVSAVAALNATQGDRFAARADVVQGPLRDEWLGWRAAEIARFHARLAEIVSAGATRSLWIVPTTLLVAGDPAARFRPVLGAAATDDALREFGLDPVLLTNHPRVVFVAPQVRGVVGAADRGLFAEANRAVSAAAATARRRAAVLVERPRAVSLNAVVPHGPFGSASVSGAWWMHAVATGVERDGALADALAIADCERVFDMAIAFTLPASPSATRLEFAALPERPLAPLNSVPPPLVVRSLHDETGTWVELVNPVAAPARVELQFDTVALPPDAASQVGRVPPQPSATSVIDVGARGVRAIRLDGGAAVTQARVTFEPAVQDAVSARVARLRRLRNALEAPASVAVLDNPGFELGGTGGATPGAAVPGWELVEPRRGSLVAVPGIAAAGGKALAFSSVNGLSSLRSNPFSRPASGRISVAAWLRIRDGDPQPPLRLALEGVHDNREYYRFAAVGGLAGGRPLAAAWSQFVLQVDDLPDTGLDALRVRFDLLGPGTVEIDEVRVFDLAFDERQREQLTRIVDRLDRQIGDGDVGGCLAGLDAYWPRYLETFVSEAPARPPTTGGPDPRRGRTGVMDRVRRLWQ